MFKIVALALAVAVSGQQVLSKNGWTRRELLSTSEILDVAAAANRDPRNSCVAMVDSNRGWAFKAADDDDRVKMCIKPCDDGRECYTLEDECDDDCEMCVRPFSCIDDNKERCKAIKECKCAQGDFQCLPSNNGFRFKKGNSPSHVPEPGEKLEPLLSKNGFYLLVDKENCRAGDTFNLIPCNPLEEECKALEPCESDDMSCCSLVPGDYLPLTTSTEAPTTTSTATSTSTTTSTD